jgi:hypothetical protein
MLRCARQAERPLRAGEEGQVMNDEPVRPLHVHESAPVERRWLNSAGYFIAFALTIGLIAAALFGFR